MERAAKTFQFLSEKNSCKFEGLGSKDDGSDSEEFFFLSFCSGGGGSWCLR